MRIIATIKIWIEKFKKGGSKFKRGIKILNKHQLEILKMKVILKHYEHTRSSRRKNVKERTLDQSNTIFRNQWRKINYIA